MFASSSFMNEFLKRGMVFTFILFTAAFLCSPSLSQAVTCSDTTTIAAGGHYTVGIRQDSTIAAVGGNFSGQLNVYSWTNIKAIAAGGYHTVGLKEDGTVVAVGNDYFGQLNVSSWTNIKAVAAGYAHTVGLKEDGTVVALGQNYGGQLNVSSWTNIKAIGAGIYHTVGLKEDGTVVAVGGNYNDQLNVSSWTNITAISAGGQHTVGLRDDGTVVAVGGNYRGQLDVSSWTNITAISAGLDFTVGLKEDGTVVAVGSNYRGQLDVSSWTNITAISAGGEHTVGLRGDGALVAVGNNYNGQLNVSSLTSIMPVCGNIQDATPPVASAAINGTAGNNGWYVSDVTVSLTATDTGSGVKEIHYSINGGTEVIVQGSSTSASFTTDGVYAMNYYAIDNAGNAEVPPKSVSVNLDKTPPAITITGIANGATYALGQVPTANYYATDSMSGVSSSVATLTGGSGFGLGTFTYAVTATDNAGNTTMMTPTYEVIATIDGSLSLISEFLASGAIDNTGLAGSLSSQLDSALAAANSGNTQTADNILNAFINHVTAQSGKHISAEAAAVLINAATYIINH